MVSKTPVGVGDLRAAERAVMGLDSTASEVADPAEIVPSRRTEFVDKMAMMLWAQWDPLNRQRDPSMKAEAVELARDEVARKCVREAERLWRVRNS